MKRLLYFVLLMICQMPLFSQAILTDDGIKRWEADFRAGLNSDGYQFDFGIGYFPIQYLGVKAQLGFDGEIGEIRNWIADDWEYSYHSRFKFTPAVVLRTPRLVNWKSQGGGFYIFMESGIILSPGETGSRRAEWINWDFKGGINLQSDRFILTIGYGITNFSLYSGLLTDHWGWHNSDTYITHSVFIGGGYKF